MSKNNQQHDEESGTTTITKKKVQLPKKYKVLLHNDDYTTMEFVIYVLQSVFHKSINEAERIMIHYFVHTNLNRKKICQKEQVI